MIDKTEISIDLGEINVSMDVEDDRLATAAVAGALAIDSLSKFD